MVSRQADPDVDRLWQEFHDHVNVTSNQLRSWLLTDAASEHGALPAGPQQALSQPGEHILGVLAKRKVDLTPQDVDIMQSTVAQIRELLDRRPSDGAADDRWRHALLGLGHDPLQEPPADR